MRHFLASALRQLYRLGFKSVPPGLTGSAGGGTSFIDAFRRQRVPTPGELLTELKNTAFTCASINAAVCASFPPRLYVTSADGQRPPRCLTKSLPRTVEQRLRNRSALPPRIAKAASIEAVLEHPLLTLFQQVNPVHNAFDLWELTTLFQEVHGSAYWYLHANPFGIPDEIWVLPAQHVTPRRAPDSANLVDHYEYRAGGTSRLFLPDEIIHFRYPDPRDPYGGGLGPLRAAWEQVTLASDYLAFKKARIENRAIPDAIVSPDELIGEEERDRLEAQWNAKFRQGGAGKVVVAESGMKVQLLNQSMGDVAALAEIGQTKQDIANAFHVPLAFLTSDTNLANLQAAEHQHLAKAITPRLRRRDEKLNEQLVRRFDPTGRLFVASDDPLPANHDLDMKQQELDMKFGVLTINEVRQERGLPPVAWGERPWLPVQWAPTDSPRVQASADVMNE